MSPCTLIVIAAIIFIIGTILIICMLFDELGFHVGLAIASIICYLLVGLSCSWVIISYNKSILEKGYYYVHSVDCGRGIIVQQIFIDGENMTARNITPEIKSFVPEGSIVRAWTYKNSRYGISWGDEERIRYDVICPGDKKYEETQKMVRGSCPIKKLGQ